jgi:hypothetical protein
MRIWATVRSYYHYMSISSTVSYTIALYFSLSSNTTFTSNNQCRHSLDLCTDQKFDAKYRWKLLSKSVNMLLSTLLPRCVV